jgi:hypothetical protein
MFESCAVYPHNCDIAVDSVFIGVGGGGGGGGTQEAIT